MLASSHRAQPAAACDPQEGAVPDASAPRARPATAIAWALHDGLAGPDALDRRRPPPRHRSARSVPETGAASSGVGATTAERYTQLALPGCDPPARPPDATVRRRHAPRPTTQQGIGQTPQGRDPLIEVFEQRLMAAGRAKKGRQAYVYQIGVLLWAAARFAGAPMGLAAIFRTPELLGRALVDDIAPSNGAQLSKWSLDQRRSAARSLATFVWAELKEQTGEDPHQILETALRTVSVRVGTVFRLPGGRPRRRGGITPEREEVLAVLAAAGEEAGYKGLRDQAFLTILAEIGARVNALRTLDGSQCLVLPDGTVRLFLHEKGKPRPREVELRPPDAGHLHAYLARYNQLALGFGWSSRIRLGQPGPVWRNSSRGCWPYRDVRARLGRACLRAGVQPFTPHALRRAFATDAARRLPRYEVALAGGWQGVDPLDECYIGVHPRELGHKHAQARSWPPSQSVEPTPHVAT